MATTLSYQSPGDPGRRPLSPQRRWAILWTLAVLAMVLVLGVSSCSYWFLGVGQPSRVVEHPSAVQVIARAGDDGIYLLRGPYEMLRWRVDHFESIQGWSRTHFAKVPELATTPEYQEESALDRASQQQGWTPVTRDYLTFDSASFAWQGCQFILDTDTTSSPARLRLRRTDAGHEWSADLTQYNPGPRPALPGE